MKTIKTQINSEKNIQSAIAILEGTGISILDCARLIKNTLDFKPTRSKISNIQHCTNVINSGIKHLHIKEMSIEKGFALYLKTKTQLRKSSFYDIKYLGKRLLRNAKYAKMDFSQITISDCEKWLALAYPTPSQFNKAHTVLNGLFNYALRQEWAERNVLRLVPKRKIIETEIKALSLAETNNLISASKLPEHKDCRAGLALMLWAGVRPQELQSITWQDIDLEENIITIRPRTSKTGGTRHIEICKVLKSCLRDCYKKIFSKDKALYNIVPPNWKKKWKALRLRAGFSTWTQDVLRHTYASYHAKNYKDLTRLQLNMGHTNLTLLRTRYINFHNISKLDAKKFFSIAS